MRYAIPLQALSACTGLYTATRAVSVPALPFDARSALVYNKRAARVQHRLPLHIMSLKRMVPFLLLNIVVSAITVFIVWTLLERNRLTTATNEGAIATLQAGLPAATLPADGLAANNAADATPTNAGAAPAAPTEATGGPVIHIVEAGETLGAISLEYDVAITDIVQANNLDSPDSIFVGQRLTIPSDEAVAESAAPTAETGPTPTPTALPTVAFAVGDSTLEISAVEDAGAAQLERIVVTNTGANAVSLNGWTISDDSGNTYTFGDFTLFGGGASITLYTRAGSDTGIEFFWAAAQPVWQSGETAALRDASGAIQAQLAVP